MWSLPRGSRHATPRSVAAGTSHYRARVASASLRLPIVALSCVAWITGCTGSGEKPPAASATTTISVPTSVPDPQPIPARHLADAVKTVLDAAVRGDDAASFPVLSYQSRVEIKDVADWSRRRRQLPTVLGFRIESGSQGDAGDRAGKVVVTVDQQPALDPFRGLSAAHERDTYTGRKVKDGWLVDAEPSVELLLPADGLAHDAAVAWVRAVQSCDKAAARALQAVDVLFGNASGAAGLCGKPGDPVAGEVGRLAPGVAATDIVAQYSTDSLGWARAVRITTPVAFSVILAPVGERWLVIGLGD